MSTEVAHYVVTAYPPGGILCATKCSFMDSAFQTLVLAKSRRLEFRATDATSDTALPIAMSLPVNGRITNLIPMSLPHHPTSLLFIITVNFQYAVICSAPGKTPYPVTTLAGGHIQPSLLGRPSESAPLAALDPYQRCLVLHLYDGFISILPIHTNYRVVLEAVKGASTASTQPSLLGEPYHLRLEESHILDIQMLITTSDQPPHICLLYQDARGFQHVVVYKLDLKARQLALVWKKQRIDGGSAKQIPLPPRSAAVASTNANATNSSHTGSLLVLGQEQITHLASGKATQVVPLPTSLILGHARLPDSIEGNYRYLLGDEFGNIHMLTVSENDLALDTLGSTAVLSSAIVYMDPAWLFVGSQHGDSQLIQIHAEPHTDGGYLQVLEDYTNLGPIVDMDWVTPQHSASVVTASGSSISGTLRLVRNGIGMKEFAAVELPGIQNMWALRSAFLKRQDAYLVQSFVTETRILGVADGGMEGDDEAATLEEIVLEGLDSSSSSLFVGNVEVADIVLQITDAEIRLVDIQRGGGCIHTWRPQEQKDITVASANEAGQIVVALRGGRLVYLKVMQEGDEKVVVKPVGEAKMTSEVSCLNLNPFTSKRGVAMETDAHPTAEPSSIVTVGLWDDFTVRVLQLDGDLKEILQINLSTEEDDEAAESLGLTSPVRRNRNNMMARSLCLITLDSASANVNSNAAPKSSGVDMLFVGLGDGTLISFAVVQQDYALSVQSKKEVSLGTQRIHLVPLQTERGGTCVLATGDRPTVIYLAGGGSRNTPKLCYSNVNLSGGDDEPTEAIAVNVATPFVSPQLFDDSSLSSKHYSLCVSDDSILRLGVIDDIQKLHVTTCRLGMAPRRIVHCPEGRLFCVGCIESGIKPVREASVTDDINMGNCLRFLDDSTFEDVQRIDLEPHEMILALANVQLAKSLDAQPTSASSGCESVEVPAVKPYLLVGTAYALPDEDEPTRGRVLVLSCADEDGGGSNRGAKHVTELEVHGGVYSISQFYNGLVLLSINSKTMVSQLTQDAGSLKLSFLGIGHHGHILSLIVSSRAPLTLTSVNDEKSSMDDSTPVKKKPAKVEGTEQLAIVADLMRSISLVQYYPEHKALEEVARDFNSNWTTAAAMLTDNLYLGAENWNNLYVLRRNAKAASEEIRCRLDTVGQFHLGEACNKFITGSLTMAYSQNSSSTPSSTTRRKAASPAKSSKEKASAASSVRTRRPVVTIGSQTLFGTVDGTLGAILGLDARTAAFFTSLERCMSKTIAPVGNFSHSDFRTFDAENRVHPSQGFVDGDLVESFLDLDRTTMEAVVTAMNSDGGWEIECHHLDKSKKDDQEDTEMSSGESILNVEDVLAMVEEMTMFH